MTAVPSVPVFANPDVLDDTDLNAIGACLTFLMGRPAWELRQTVAQTITTATGTAVTFTTGEDHDSANGHSTSVNTSRYVGQYAGRHRVSGIVAWSPNATGRRAGWWSVNGTAVPGSQFGYPATAASDGEFVAPTLSVFLNVGDYVELYAYHEKGSNLDTFATLSASCRMSGIWEKVS